MGRLKIEKQEVFAQAYAVHRNQAKAAVAAGYSTKGAHVAGSRLMSQPQVAQRVKELLDAADKAKMRAVTADRAWVMKMLVANAEDAVEAKDRAAANRALELVGKEIGMFVDRKLELKSPLDDLSADQLLAIVRLAEAVGDGASMPVLDASSPLLTNQSGLPRIIDMIDVSPVEVGTSGPDVPIKEEDDAI